ncbi:4695a46b-74b4-4dc4-80cd-4c4bbfdbab91 [Sclerotinia trifoliorum]|uniref:4695a46b-74b4-4dc4-80cd-4c4bbfdbab91 n=1 Tax=Sclerotinia trifoliorum TaxID=28548 RepID=A0A8H2VT19_9HELO|nr:4695a46b-74b4-4dc4-80cd-4c4bbfdbab91 [Sclerotinia trifoliorum]
MATYPTDDQDFKNASAGLVSRMDNCIIHSDTDESVVIWDNQTYESFINDDATCPKEVDPSLFRQSQLCVKQGLFEIIKDKIYQVRGLDISNMTFVETIDSNGVVVIDPLTSIETAKKAIELYQGYRKDKKILAMIYTHSHADHFGGGNAVVEASGGTQEHPYDGTLQDIYAPADFLDHAVSENVYAGVAMGRRAVYMYGESLEKSPTGQVGTGLGMATSTGASSLIPPTISISKTGHKRKIDGLDIVFQVTPGTEAPSEMNFHFPQYNALCMAENATHTLHNLQTLRGALVRDARVWSRYLDEAIVLFADKSDVLFASHHWPTFKSDGGNEIIEFLSGQRDLYAYLHNETLRQINNGQVGIEIAETFQMPSSLESIWSTKGYYGSISHNVKAIYDRYMGWFDGNPAHLWEHPPVAIAKRYVFCMGGIENVIKLARENYINVSSPDYRFAATLLSHAVFSDQSNLEAKTELANVFTKLGYGSENATWRNFYLCGAKELLGPIQPAMNAMNTASWMALSIEQLLDSMAIRINGPLAIANNTKSFKIEVMLSDVPMSDARTNTDTSGWHINFSNAVMTDHEITYSDTVNTDVDFTVWVTHQQFVDLVIGNRVDFEGLKTEGDEEVWGLLFGLLDMGKPGFAIVTPEA